MAILKINSVLAAESNAITTLIDTGAGSNGTLEFQTAGDVEVATITLGTTSFGASTAGGLSTMNATTDDTSATGNASPVTKFIMKDQDGNEVYRGSATITSGGGDIELSAVVIGAGSTVSITSYTYQAA